MKGAKNVPREKFSPLSRTDTTEVTLVRLLQDNLSWDLQPLQCVKKLLEQLNHIDNGVSNSSREDREETNTTGNDDQECLNSLQSWLKNLSTCSTNKDNVQDWKLCSHQITSDGTIADSKGNRYYRILI